MTGRVTIKNDKYYAIINLPAVNNKYQTKWIPIANVKDITKAKAQKELQKIIQEYTLKYASLYSTPLEKREYMNVLLVDWIDDYVKSRQNTLSPNVFWNYCRRVQELRNFPPFQKKKLIDTTAQDLILYYNYKRKQGCKDTTIKKVANIIHPALRNAYNLDILSKDITAQIPHFKESKPPIKYFDKEELEKFLQVIKGHKFEIAFKLACYYGFRRSEIIGLKWDAIDFTRKTITIKHKVTICRRKIWAEDKLKSESSFRTLPLIPEIEQDLILHKQQIELNKKYYGSAYDDKYKDYVIVDAMGKLLFPDNLTHNFQLVLKKHKLKYIRFHDLRHSCASLLLSTGIHMKQIQEWLGHADFSTTANIYSHLDYSSKIESAKNISNALNGVYVDKEERELAENSPNNFVQSVHDPYKNKREITEDFPLPKKEEESTENNQVNEKPKLTPEELEAEYEEFQAFLRWREKRKNNLDSEM